MGIIRVEGALSFNYRALLVRISKQRSTARGRKTGAITYSVDFLANDKNPCE